MSENKYNPREIEAEAQKFWEEEKVFEVSEDLEKEKFYCLCMFPYPSRRPRIVGSALRFSTFWYEIPCALVSKYRKLWQM